MTRTSPTPLEPADIERAADGTPCSARYGDVYHTRAGGLEQARHVFLAANGLPSRWQGHERFVIVETGFGLGLNFLATWTAWRDDPEHCDQLHYVSVELHPLRAPDLATLHTQWPELASLAGELHANWPALTPGLHRLHLDGGRVVLTLLFGDARTLLPQLDCRADAFYLDGFSPARNPELWTPPLLGELARLAAPAATLATWSVSGPVRRALQEAGFDCTKAPGFAGKREMLVARFAAEAAPADAGITRHAIVIGAGLAGSAVAHRLAERGWTVDVIESADGPGQGASGNLTGVLRPLPSLDDNRLARITRAGALYGLAHLRRLTDAGLPVRWNACGVLHLAREATHEARQREVVEAQRPPEGYLRYVDRDEASRLAGWPVSSGGWWFPGGAWVAPATLCAANLAAFPDRIRCHYSRALARLARDADQWQAFDAAGALIASAPHVILANGVGIRSLSEAATLPVRSARGQVTHLAADESTPPNVVVCRLGYVSPAVDGIQCAGATFAVDDDETELRATDQAENLGKLQFMLPGRVALNADLPLAGRVGFRPASPDRLPMVGALASVTTIDRATPLAAIPRYPGLHVLSGFGARGLVWSALAGELLASRLHGDPLPLERELVDALDPARFLLKPARRFQADA